jgi:hypothetical protein
MSCLDASYGWVFLPLKPVLSSLYDKVRVLNVEESYVLIKKIAVYAHEYRLLNTVIEIKARRRRLRG